MSGDGEMGVLSLPISSHLPIPFRSNARVPMHELELHPPGAHPKSAIRNPQFDILGSLVLAESKLSDFLEAVAAKTPTPGGGSVSAAVGALGAALGVMAARFSVHPEAERALDDVKKALLAVVDQDAEAYGQVNSAMALPKSTEEEKKRRKEALQIALSEAAEVPLKGMTLAASGLRSLAGLAPACNRHLVSDLVGAATFLEAALQGCGENVKVNAASLVDKAKRERLESEHARLSSEAGALRQQAVTAARKVQVAK